AALMLQMQQTYGNRAVQRFLKQSANTHPIAAETNISRDVQRFLQRTKSIAAPAMNALPMQCCGGEVHEGCGCADESLDLTTGKDQAHLTVGPGIGRQTPLKQGDQVDLAVQTILPSSF